jgi:flagella basal body P-ring formation protein FlgA
MRELVKVGGSVAIGWSLATSCAYATGSDDHDIVALATRELSAEVRRAYPDVVDWTIAPIAKTMRDAPPSDVVANIEVLKTGPRSAVRMTWREHDGSQRTRTLWFEVAGRRPVLVTVRDFAAREELLPADLAANEQDVLRLGCTPIHSEDEVAGMRAKRALRSGAAICREAIEPQPAVARGDKVTVRYESERVSLTSKGVAQQDARIGEMLRVVNPATKDSFTAVVSGVHEVIVHE